MFKEILCASSSADPEPLRCIKMFPHDSTRHILYLNTLLIRTHTDWLGLSYRLWVILAKKKPWKAQILTHAHTSTHGWQKHWNIIIKSGICFKGSLRRTGRVEWVEFTVRSLRSLTFLAWQLFTSTSTRGSQSSALQSQRTGLQLFDVNFTGSLKVESTRKPASSTSKKRGIGNVAFNLMWMRASHTPDDDAKRGGRWTELKRVLYLN